MSGMFTDRWGVPVAAVSAESVAELDTAIEDLVALAGDPAGGAEKAAADGQLILARIYQAYLNLYGTTPAGVAAARTILATVPEPPAGQREHFHRNAARAWADGRWEAATRWLEQALLANPRDLLALKVGQDLNFFLGNRLELRDSPARVLRHWPEGSPGWGYVQGIYAFGLEENADYRQAEQRATTALAVKQEDVWSVHALAHVYEMEGRHDEGVAFLTRTVPDWRGSYFAVHNWWHLGLYHLELLRLDQVVALYDERIRGNHSTEWLDVVDAAAMLWRLRLFGVDVASRAQALAADIDALVTDPVYVFNDWHAVMTFGLAGDMDRVSRILAANEHMSGTNLTMWQRAGRALLHGFAAFAAGDAERALDELIDIRQHANAVGGSHAQRDVIDLTLIAAAAQARQGRLAEALVAERVARKPPAAPSAGVLAAIHPAG